MSTRTPKTGEQQLSELIDGLRKLSMRIPLAHKPQLLDCENSLRQVEIELASGPDKVGEPGE